MPDGVKNYVINITAKADQAQKKLEELAKVASELQQSTNKITLTFDDKVTAQLNKSMSSLTGAIGKVQEGVNKIQTSFDKLSADQIIGEVQELSSTLSESVNGMKKSFDGFADSFKSLSGEGNQGFSKTFSDFTDTLNNMMQSYKTVMETIENLATGATPVDTLRKSLDNLGKPVSNAVAHSKEELEKAQEEIEILVDKMNDSFNKMRSISESGTYKVKNKKGETVDKTASKAEILNLEEQASSFISSIRKLRAKYGSELDFQQLVWDELGVSEFRVNDVRQKLGQQYDGILQAEKQERQKFEQERQKQQFKDKQKRQTELDLPDEETEVNVNVGVTVNIAEFDENKINEIVDAIKEKITTRVQDGIEPIRIPIRVEGQVEKSDEDPDITNKDAQKGLVKTLKIQVETNKDQLYASINDAIADMGDNIPKIPVKVVAQMDNQSVKDAALDIENQLIDDASMKGTANSVFNAGNANIGSVILSSSGGLATEAMQSSILAAINSLSINGVKLSQTTGNTAMANKQEPQDNSDIYLKNLEKRLGYFNRSKQLTSDKANELRTTEYNLAALADETNRGRVLKDFLSIVKSEKKTISDLEKSEIFTRSYKDAKGVERAWYDDRGETLGQWQIRLKEMYKMYESEFSEKIDGATVLDDKGNIVSEGVRTKYARMKGSSETVQFLNRDMKEWQKVLIESANDSKNKKLNSQATLEKIAVQNSAQIELIRQQQLEKDRKTNVNAQPMSKTDAAKRLVNEQFNEYMAEVLSHATMTPQLEEQFNKISSGQVQRVKNEILKDNGLIAKTGVSKMPFDVSLMGANTLSTKRKKMLTDNLRANGVELDPETGRILASKISAPNEEEGTLAITNMLKGLAKEQAPKLAQAESNVKAAQKTVDDIGQFIDLYTKKATGKDLSEEETGRLEDLRTSLNDYTVDFLATGDVKKRFDDAKKVKDAYERDLAEDIKNGGTGLSSERLADYNKAMDTLANVGQANLDQVFQFASGFQEEAQRELTAAQKQAVKLKSSTRTAAKDIADSNEVLKYAAEGSEEQYKARQKQIETNTKRLGELRSIMGIRDGNGSYNTSTLTKPEQQEYNDLVKRTNELKSQQHIYELINKEKWKSIEADESMKPTQTSELSDKARIKNLHVSDETAKALVKAPTFDNLSDLSSEQIAEFARIKGQQVKEQEEYLGKVSQDFDAMAQKRLAQDIDDLNAKRRKADSDIKRLTKKIATETDESKKHKLELDKRDAENAKKAAVESLKELTNTPEDIQESVDKIATLDIESRMINDRLAKHKIATQKSSDIDRKVQALQEKAKSITDAKDLSSVETEIQAAIEERDRMLSSAQVLTGEEQTQLTQRLQAISKEKRGLANEGHVRGSRQLDVEKTKKQMATARIEEIDQEIKGFSLSDIDKELNLPGVKDIPKLLEEVGVLQDRKNRANDSQYINKDILELEEIRRNIVARLKGEFGSLSELEKSEEQKSLEDIDKQISFFTQKQNMSTQRLRELYETRTDVAQLLNMPDLSEDVVAAKQKNLEEIDAAIAEEEAKLGRGTLGESIEQELSSKMLRLKSTLSNNEDNPDLERLRTLLNERDVMTQTLEESTSAIFELAAQSQEKGFESTTISEARLKNYSKRFEEDFDTTKTQMEQAKQDQIRLQELAKERAKEEEQLALKQEQDQKLQEELAKQQKADARLTSKKRIENAGTKNDTRISELENRRNELESNRKELETELSKMMSNEEQQQLVAVEEQIAKEKSEIARSVNGVTDEFEKFIREHQNEIKDAAKTDNVSENIAAKSLFGESIVDSIAAQNDSFTSLLEQQTEITKRRNETAQKVKAIQEKIAETSKPYLDEIKQAEAQQISNKSIPEELRNAISSLETEITSRELRINSNTLHNKFGAISDAEAQKENTKLESERNKISQIVNKMKQTLNSLDSWSGDNLDAFVSSEEELQSLEQMLFTDDLSESRMQNIADTMDFLTARFSGDKNYVKEKEMASRTKEKIDQIKQKMSEETSAKYSAELTSISSDEKSEMQQLRDVQTQLATIRNQVVTQYLSELESQIIADQDALMQAVRNNDQTNITDKAKSLLQKVAKYQSIKPQESFQSDEKYLLKLGEGSGLDALTESVYSGYGFINGQSIVSWAKNYLSNSGVLEGLQKQRNEIVNRIGGSRGNVSANIESIDSEIQMIDQEIDNLVSDTIHSYIEQLAKEATTTKSKAKRSEYLKEIEQVLNVYNSLLSKSAEGQIEDLRKRERLATGKGDIAKAQGLRDRISELERTIGVNTTNTEAINKIKTSDLGTGISLSTDDMGAIHIVAREIAVDSPNVEIKSALKSEAGQRADEKREKVLEEYRKDHPVDKRKYYDDKEEATPWRSWYYANMTEDEAIITKQIKQLVGKSMSQKASDKEILKLATLKQKAREMGLDFTDNGYVKSKVSYEDFMADPSKYIIPTISKEKAEAAGVTTQGLKTSGIQSVSVTEPVAVSTVGQVASVNLGTIEALLSSIAAKIGADTSGIKFGAQGGKGKYSNNKENLRTRLNNVLLNKNSTQAEKDAALREGLASGWLGLGKNIDGSVYLAKKRGRKYDKDITEEYIQKLGVKTNKKNTQKNVKQQTDGLKAQLNKILQNPDSTQEQINDAIVEALSRPWFGLGENKETKRPFIATKGKKKYDADYTEKYLREHNISIPQMTEKKEQPKTQEKNKTKTTQQNKKEISPMRKLAQQANADYMAAKDDAERLELMKKYVSQGLLIGKNTSGKRKGELYFGAKNGDKKMTEDFIKEHNLAVNVPESNRKMSDDEINTLFQKYQQELDNALKQINEQYSDVLQAKIDGLKQSIANVTTMLESNGYTLKDGKWQYGGEETKETKQKGKIAGAKDRDYKAYTDEDFKKQEGLAEQVIKSGKSQIGKDTDAGRFWKESIANAQAYIEACAQAKNATEGVAEAENQSVTPLQKTKNIAKTGAEVAKKEFQGIHSTGKEAVESIMKNGLRLSGPIDTTVGSLQQYIVDAAKNEITRFSTHQDVDDAAVLIDLDEEVAQLFRNTAGIFTEIPGQLIRGYIDELTGEFIKNPIFDENFDIVGYAKQKLQEAESQQQSASGKPRPQTNLVGQKFVEDFIAKHDTARQPMVQMGETGATAGQEIANGQEQAQGEIEQTTAAVIDLTNALTTLSSMKDIFATSGKEGLVDSLKGLTVDQLKDIIKTDEFGFDKTKISGLRKYGLIDRIASGVEAKTYEKVPEPKDTSGTHKKNADAKRDEASATRELSQAEKEEAKAKEKTTTSPTSTHTSTTSKTPTTSSDEEKSTNKPKVSKEVSDLANEYKWLTQNAQDANKYLNMVDDGSEAYNARMVWLENYIQRMNDAVAKMNEYKNATSLTASEVEVLSKAEQELADKQRHIEDANIKEAKHREDVIASTTSKLSAIPEEDKKNHAEGYAELTQSLETLNQRYREGIILEKEYNQERDNAFASFKKWQAVRGEIIGERVQTKDRAEEIFNKYVQDNYKTTIRKVAGGKENAQGVSTFTAQVVDAEGHVQNLTFEWSKFTNQVSLSSSSVATDFKSGFLGLLSELQAKTKQLFVYWTAQFLNPYQLIGSFKQVINIVKEYDDALTEMRKVSDESVSSLKNFQIESFSQANKVGTTALQLQQSTADWLRLGEDFETAQKSAQTSNILLNVSEFSSIDEATESLVAMSQAYKELDKNQIIDKLNNIGNNFSISTSDLAQSLQRSAGTLTVTGDTLDEAIALTTAANQTLQNPEMVGQSLKTMALRLSGTSVQDMQEAGEEIDGLISTQSKLRKAIMDATKVSSNNYKGFDILNDDGSYKTTYERLLGIAEVFKEIGEEDKKLGTNRQSYLLETIAGKTRAAAASSILENPDVLRQVYETSLQSEGSAQQELDKYLDSVSGKLQKAQNTIQELANTTIDSEGLKTVLDIINAILNAVASLTESLGGLNLIIGSIGGLLFQKRGLGLLNVDKETGKLTSIFSKFGKNARDSVASITTELSGMTNLNTTTVAQMIDGSSFNTLSDGLKEYLNSIPEAERGTMSLATALAQAKETGQTVGSVFSGLTGVIKSLGATLLTIGASILASFAISKGIEALVNAINWKENKIKAGKEAQQTIDDIKSNYDEQNKFATEESNEYFKLRQNVDTTTNKNETLSTENYERYLELNKQMAQLFPSLISGYDSQGNALLNLSSDTDTARQSLDELLETQRKISQYKVGEELPKVIDSTITQIQDATNIISEAQESLTALVNTKNILPHITEGDLSALNLDDSLNLYYELPLSSDENNTNQAFQAKVQTAYLQALKDADIDYSGKYQDRSGFGAVYDEHGQEIISETYVLDFQLDYEATDEQIKDFKESFSSRFNDLLNEDYPELVAQYQAQITEQTAEIAAIWNGVVPSLISQMELYDDYQAMGDLKVGEQLQQIISDDISNLDIMTLSEKQQADFIDNPRKFLRNMFLEPMIKAITDNGELSDDLANNLIKLVTPDDGETAKEYKDRVREYLEGIFGTSEEGKKKRYELEVALGIGFYNDPKHKKGFEYYVNQQLQDAQEVVDANSEGIVKHYRNVIKKNIDNTNEEIQKNRKRRLEVQDELDQGAQTGISNAKINALTNEKQLLDQQYDGLLKNQEAYENQLMTAQKYADQYKEDMATLDMGQLTAFNKMQDAGEFENGLPETFEKLVKEINEFIAKNPDIETAKDTLSDLFTNEDYKENASNYESKLSSANTALESLRENGELTADEMKTLQEAFPDLTEFSKAAIKDKGFKQLSDWIKEIRSNMDDMSPEGIEQTNTYIQHLIESMGDLADSTEDTRNLFMQLHNVPEDTSIASHEQRKGLEQLYESNIQALQEALGDEEIDYNIVGTLIAKNEFTGPIEQIIAKYKDYKFFWTINLNKEAIESDIARLESVISRKEAENTLKTSTGGYLESSDYDEILKSKAGIYQDRQKQTGFAIGDIIKNQDAKSITAFNEAWAAQTQAQSDWWAVRREQTEAGTNGIQEAIKTATADADKMSQEIEQNQKNNVRNSQTAHDALRKAYEDQAVGYEQDVDYWTGILNSPWKLFTSGFSASEVRDKISESESSAVTARENAAAASYGMNTENLKYLGNEYADLQTMAQNINDEISVKQAKGLKITEKEYQKLQKISKAQVSNLSDQNKELKASQKHLKENSDEWRNIQSQIDSNNSSIASAIADIESYDNTIKNLVISDAQELSQAISSAFSEMTSETGISTDTIQAISTGFGELADAADISSIFYGTADGIKVDVIQLERLAKQQNALVNQNFAQKMDEITEAMQRAGKAGDTTGLKNAQHELAELQRQQAQYLALYQEQMEQFSRLAEIARADQTKNEGADFETAVGYMKTAKELYDKGLIGTDDFKTRAAYLDPYGRTDWQTFEQNYKKAERYLTEDQTGMNNFLNDLREKGLATFDDLTGWTLDFADSAKAALEMGMSDEFFMDVIGRLNDFGAGISYVSSMEEAAAKTSDLRQQLTDARIEYAELVNMGASDEVLSQKQQQIDGLTTEIENLEHATNNYVEGSQKSFVEGFNNIEATMTSLQSSYQEAMKIGDFQGMEQIAKEVQRYADKYDLEITIDAKTGEIKIDQDSMDAAAEKMGKSMSQKMTESLRQEYEDASQYVRSEQRKFDETGWDSSQTKFGNIDMNNREVFTYNAQSIERNRLGLKDIYGDAISDYRQFVQDMTGVVSTVEGAVGTYGDQSIPIAYSPMLQTGTGEPRILDQRTLNQYLEGLMSKVYTEGGGDLSSIFKFDEEGLTVSGQHISGLVADIGATAEETAEKMHYLGKYGSLAMGAVDEQTAKANMEMGQFISDNKDRFEEIISMIQNASAEDLASILFGDKELASDSAGQIESAIDSILSEFGLTQEQGNILYELLKRIASGEWDIDATSNMDEINEQLEAGLHRIKELQAHNVITLSFDVEEDPTKVTDLQTLQQRKQELHTAQANVQQGSIEQKAMSALEGQYDRQYRIQTVLQGADEAKATLEELQGMSKNDLKKIDVFADLNDDELEALFQQIQSMDPEEVPVTIKIDDSQFTELLETIAGSDPEVEVDADTSPAGSKVDKLDKDTRSRRPIFPVNANTAPAMNSASSAVSGINGMTASINVGVTGLEAVRQTILSTINSIKSQASIVIRTLTSAGGATGTMVAKASGTAYNVLNYKRIGAYAKGTNVSLDQDEYALTNELGQESVVRDGHWYTLPGGPHFEHLKKGDIVFNAKQTEDLIKKGKTPNHARALATGTIYSGMPAHGDPTNNSGVYGKFKIGTNTSNANAQKAADNANKAAKGAGKAAEAAKTGLDAFKEWIEKLVDWIEVRLNRLQYKVDLNSAKSENAIGPTAKNKYVQAAMDVIGNAKNPDKSKSGTLIGDNIAGAKRYQKQADKVRSQAISNKLVSASEADEIIKKIKNGKIDIEEYGEEAREFISQYTTWYEKVLECKSAVEDLKQQLKELEQTKLDNIVENYDVLVERSKAFQESSVAMNNFYTAMGKTVNSKEAKQELNSQMKRQNEITGYYEKQVAKYKKELETAKSVFGANSIEYRQAQTKLEEMNKSVTESKTAFLDLQKQLYELDLTKIDRVIDRISGFGDKLSAMLTKIQNVGQSYGQSDSEYITSQATNMYRQINTNNSMIEQYGVGIAERLSIISEKGYEVDSDEYKNLYDWIQKAETECINLVNANEELKQSIRNLRWEPYKNLQNDIKNVVSDMQHLADLIDDAEVFDIEDQVIITDRGLTKLALYGIQLQENTQYIANERAALEKLQEEYEKGTISKQQYTEESQEHIKSVQDMVKANQSLKKSIIDVYKTQVSNENKALQDLISLRKSALSAKKSYYDYNKTLRNQNKELQQLRAEAAALTGVKNAASQARLAQIRSDIQDKELDQQETRFDHSVDVQQSGYDKLGQYASDSLDKTLRTVEGSMYAQELVIANMLEQVKGNYDLIYGQIQTIIGTTGTVVTDTSKKVVEDTPTILEPLMSKYEAYKATLLTYIKEITDKINGQDPNSISSQLDGVSQQGGALERFGNNTITEFGKVITGAGDVATAVGGIGTAFDGVSGSAGGINTSLSTMGTSLFGLVTGDSSAFSVFKNLSLQNVNPVSDAFKTLGINIDNILTELNKPITLTFNDATESLNKALGFNTKADEAVSKIVTDNIGTLTEKSKDIVEKIEKDVYDKTAKGIDDINVSATPIAVKAEEKKEDVQKKVEEAVKNVEAEDALTAEVAAPEEITSQIEDALTAQVAAPEEVQPKKETKKTTTAADTKKTTKTTTKSTPKLDDKTKKYVAAAIVNGNQGWGSGSERKKLLTEVFGANNGIQAIVDADKKNGYAQAAKIINQIGFDGIKAYSYLKMRKKYKGYKKGTTGVPSDDTFWTHPDELIIRKSDGAVLTPLSKGSPVFPANLAENLWKWGSMTPADFMKGFDIDTKATVANNVVNVTNNYDSLLTVNGNVDKDALPELQEILKQACEYTNKYNAREARKLGKK